MIPRPPCPLYAPRHSCLGVHFLTPTSTLLSVGLDQRLCRWSLLDPADVVVDRVDGTTPLPSSPSSWSSSPSSLSKTLALREVAMVDIADQGCMHVHVEDVEVGGGGSTGYALIAGMGLQVFATTPLHDNVSTPAVVE